jgi:hypothetical protein
MIQELQHPREGPITAQCQGTLEFPPGATERFIEIEPLGEGIDGFVWRDDKEVEPDSDAF